MDPHTLLITQITSIQAKNPHDPILAEIAQWLPSPQELGETGVHPLLHLDKCLPRARENAIRHITALVMAWSARQQHGERVSRQLRDPNDGLLQSVEGEILAHFQNSGELITQGEIVQRVPVWKGREARIVRRYLQTRELPTWKVYCRQVIDAHPWS